MRAPHRAEHPVAFEQGLLFHGVERQVLRQGVHQLVVGNGRRDVHLGARALDHRTNQRLEPVPRVAQGGTVIGRERVEQRLNPPAAIGELVVLGERPGTAGSRAA